jgi:hypothetical protein
VLLQPLAERRAKFCRIRRRLVQDLSAYANSYAARRSRGHNRMEVTKAVPQSSHDQLWSIRPLALNRDSSAISKMQPQRGHFGRLSFSVDGT